MPEDFTGTSAYPNSPRLVSEKSDGGRPTFFWGKNVPRDARLLTRRIASPPRKMADKIDKGVKRKRLESKLSKTSKKVAIEDDRKIKISFQEAEKWAPIVGTDSSHDRGSLKSLY